METFCWSLCGQDVSDSREELEQDDGPTAVCAAAADASSSGSKVAETQTESGFSKVLKKY